MLKRRTKQCTVHAIAADAVLLFAAAIRLGSDKPALFISLVVLTFQRERSGRGDGGGGEAGREE